MSKTEINRIITHEVEDIEEGRTCYIQVFNNPIVEGQRISSIQHPRDRLYSIRRIGKLYAPNLNALSFKGGYAFEDKPISERGYAEEGRDECEIASLDYRRAADVIQGLLLEFTEPALGIHIGKNMKDIVNVIRSDKLHTKELENIKEIEDIIEGDFVSSKIIPKPKNIRQLTGLERTIRRQI